MSNHKITYSYCCDNCKYTFDCQQYRQAKSYKKCPKCKKHKLYRIYSLLHVSIKREPTTIYHQAARNTEKAGKYELAELHKHSARDCSKDPFWRKNRSVNHNLNKLTKKQQREYIIKGVLPNESYKPGNKVRKVEKTKSK